jgi:hypothetical protein
MTSRPEMARILWAMARWLLFWAALIYALCWAERRYR